MGFEVDEMMTNSWNWAVIMQAKRRWLVYGALCITVSGCRTAPKSPVVLPAPTTPLAALELAATTNISSLEPEVKTLPRIDSQVSLASFAPPSAEYLSITPALVRKEARERASLAALLQPDSTSSELAGHLAAEARLRATTTAMTQFYQLADAEARIEIVRESVVVLDKLRETVREAKAKQLRLPIEPEELERRRVELLATLSQAELGAKLLDIDLKRRIGLSDKTLTRLRPAELPMLSTEPFDVEASINKALETRPDLLALRKAYQVLSPENLPTIRDVLTSYGSTLPPVARRRLDRSLEHSSGAEASLFAELGLRRQQLFDLIGERERQAADEIRAASASLESQTQQVGLARTRLELADAKRKSVAGQGPLFEAPAELEHLRARADLIAAVMVHHQAKNRRDAAVGVD
jgi:hypothetical protein